MSNWTDHPLTAGKPNKAVYIQELREALDEKRKEMGLSPVDWKEPINKGEPKKYSHTQQLMLACENTARQSGYASIEELLGREWTLIQQGKPYKFQIINDLREAVEKIPPYLFIDRFPGTELNLNKWYLETGYDTSTGGIRKWSVNEKLIMEHIHPDWNSHTEITFRTKTFRFPEESFSMEWDASHQGGTQGETWINIGNLYIGVRVSELRVYWYYRTHYWHYTDDPPTFFHGLGWLNYFWDTPPKTIKIIVRPSWLEVYCDNVLIKQASFSTGNWWYNWPLVIGFTHWRREEANTIGIIDNIIIRKIKE